MSISAQVPSSPDDSWLPLEWDEHLDEWPVKPHIEVQRMGTGADMIGTSQDPAVQSDQVAGDVADGEPTTDTEGQPSTSTEAGPEGG